MQDFFQKLQLLILDSASAIISPVLGGAHTQGGPTVCVTRFSDPCLLPPCCFSGESGPALQSPRVQRLNMTPLRTGFCEGFVGKRRRSLSFFFDRHSKGRGCNAYNDSIRDRVVKVSFGSVVGFCGYIGPAV